MVHKLVFTVAIYATSILAQNPPLDKQISTLGDRKNNIFQWADFAKPRTNRFDTRRGDTGQMLISDPAIKSRPPGLEIGFPSASEVVRPQNRAFPVEGYLARETSVVSDQVLQSQVDKQQRQSSPTGKEPQTQVVRQVKQSSQTGKVLLSQVEKPKQPFTLAFTSSTMLFPADKQPKQSSASRAEPLSRIDKQPKQPLKSSSSFLKMPTDLPSEDTAPERRRQGGPQTDLNWDYDCDDISIIGAGIAGAYAGYRLRDLGKKITIYEYSDRIGGRCYTGKMTGIPDVNVEYGAMRFKPKEHKLLTQVIKDLGLKIVHFDPQFGPFSDSNLYLRGRHIRYGDIPRIDLPYYLPKKFKGKTPHEINW